MYEKMRSCVRMFQHVPSGLLVWVYPDLVVVRDAEGIVVARALKVYGRKQRWVCPEIPQTEIAACVLASATTNVPLARWWRLAWPKSFLYQNQKYTCDDNCSSTTIY